MTNFLVSVTITTKYKPQNSYGAELKANVPLYNGENKDVQENKK